MLLKKLKSKGIETKFIRCDNAGENYKFQEKVIDAGLKIKFEFTAVGTPQQNGIAERAFSTLFGRVRAVMNYSGIEGELRKMLWAECAATCTLLDGLLVDKTREKCS